MTDAALQARFLKRDHAIPEKQRQSLQFEAYRFAVLLTRTVPDGPRLEQAVDALESAVDAAVAGIVEGGVR